MRKIKITRDQAEHWLGSSSVQRRIRGRVVEQYCREMLNGVWDPDVAPPILIDENSEGVLNGQHRLKAFLMSELPYFESYVHFVSRASLPVMDTGPTRNLVDTLDFRGHDPHLTQYMSAWLNRGVQWVTGSKASVLLTRTEQVNVIEEAPNVMKAAEAAKYCANKKMRVVRVPIGTTAALYDIMEYSFGGNLAIEFVERLQTSDSLTPVMARLQAKMIESDNPKAKATLHPDAKSYLIARVFNAYINDENLSRMYSRRASVYELPGYSEWVEATFNGKLNPDHQEFDESVGDSEE